LRARGRDSRPSRGDTRIHCLPESGALTVREGDVASRGLKSTNHQGKRGKAVFSFSIEMSLS
jgi:hypothetical protein